MFIPRYWSKAETQAQTPQGYVMPVACWRGSPTSVADAETLAREAVERMASRIGRGEGFPDRYAYGDRPVREEVLEEIADASGQVVAVLTRNGYGCEVLNAARVLFIDVDLAPARPAEGPLVRLARRFLPFLVAAPRAPEADALARLAAWVDEHRGWRVRVYRTRSGLRYLVTHALFEPGGPESEAAMEYLGCDPQYMRLCRVQKSFRARLTPKPWRCGLKSPTVRFPWKNDDEERSIREWEREYAAITQDWATCALLDVVGGPAVIAPIATLVARHDQTTRVDSGLPLA
jgi:hypothetical protein